MNHYRQTLKKYKARKNQSQCPFCSQKTVKKAIKETTELYVVPNLTQYDLWELHDVIEHLLVVPRRHVTTLNELTQTERSGLMDILAWYESQGFNVYARGVDFVNRSVAHQHTHLIKVSNRKPRASLFIHKPYILWKV